MSNNASSINLHCPNCGLSFEVHDLTQPEYKCPSCDHKIVMRSSETIKIPETAVLQNTQLSPGLTLGGFELVEEIGRGGMGVVYKAMQKSLDREVALKILPKHLADDAEFIKRFNVEAHALASLKHPNIVSILEKLEHNGIYFFVMEYVEGLSLRKLLRKQKLTLLQTLEVISQICSALTYAHSCGIIHRDIKPENILIDKQGTVKITDFGLSRIVKTNSEFSRITNTAVTMGTFDYMAPEQRVSSKSADYRADIYAVGVILYELLTQELPVGNFEKLSSLMPELPYKLDEVIMKALQYNPEKRYQKIDELKKEIMTVVSDVKNKKPSSKKEPPFILPVAARVAPQAAPIMNQAQESSQKQLSPLRKIFSYRVIVAGLIVSIFLPIRGLMMVFIVLLIVRGLLGDLIFGDGEKHKGSQHFPQPPTNSNPMPPWGNYEAGHRYQRHGQGFRDKKEIKAEIKIIKEKIKQEIKQAYEADKTEGKDKHILKDIDQRIETEVSKRVSEEIDKIKNFSNEKPPKIGILTFISMFIFLLGLANLLALGSIILYREFFAFEFYQYDFSTILKFVDWSAIAGSAILFAIVLFAGITSGACKKFNIYGRAFALFTLFTVITSSFFWYNEYSDLKDDVQVFENIKKSEINDSKEFAVDLQDIIVNPETLNLPAESTRFLAFKLLFDNSTNASTEKIVYFANSLDEDIITAWIQAWNADYYFNSLISYKGAKLSTKTMLEILNSRDDRIKKLVIKRLAESYKEGWDNLKEAYPKLSLENRKFVLEQIDSDTPVEIIDWLLTLDDQKLYNEIYSALFEFRCLKALPIQAELLFNELYDVSNRAYDVLGEYKLANTYSILIEYIRSGKENKLKSQIIHDLESVTKKKFGWNAEAWRNWLNIQNLAIYNELQQSIFQGKELMVELESTIVNDKNVLYIYANVCSTLKDLYFSKIKQIQELGPAKYENLVDLSELISQFELFVSDLCKTFPMLNSNESAAMLKSECDRMKFIINKKLTDKLKK